MIAVQLSLPGVVAQRWLEGEECLAADDDPIDTWNYEIAPIPDDNSARAFIERHHYSGTYVAARRRFGLWHRSGELRGVAVFSVPLSLHSLDVFQLDDPGAGLELGRLVLLDGVRKMGESWFVAEAFRRLRREGFRAVVSFSDPVPRTTADGRQVVPGHVGIVYQALSARWMGRSKADTLRLLPDGRVVHRRAMQKIRGEERGWEWEVMRLQAYGAGPLDREPRAWVDHWLPRITRHCATAGTIGTAGVSTGGRGRRSARRTRGHTRRRRRAVSHRGGGGGAGKIAFARAGDRDLEEGRMGKRSAKVEAGARARRGERGVPLTQTLDAIGLLLAKPSRPTDLVEALGCSRRTVERLLQKIELAGLPPEVVHAGRNAYYSLRLETLHKRLRVK